MDVEVIVSRFARDVSWAEKLSTKNVIVYDKGGSYEGPLPCVILDNVGRESHTHLRHIVACYDRLADWTVFCQDDNRDHLPTDFPFEHFLDPHLGITGGFLYTNIREWDDKGYLRHFGKWEEDWMTGRMRQARWPFTEWLEKFVKVIPAETGIHYLEAGLFGVHRDIVHRRSRSYYAALLNSLGWDANPEEAYYMERAWLYAFGFHAAPTPLRVAMAFRQVPSADLPGMYVPAPAPDLLKGLSTEKGAEDGQASA